MTHIKEALRASPIKRAGKTNARSCLGVIGSLEKKLKSIFYTRITKNIDTTQPPVSVRRQGHIISEILCEIHRMLATVVIPCYNEKNGIRETIENIYSIFAKKNVNNIEVIIVTDGSRDGTDKVLDSLEEEYKNDNFHVLHHKRNQGYGASLKTGIRRSKGDYICITDADGTYPNDRIPELINIEDKKELYMFVGARV